MTGRGGSLVNVAHDAAVGLDDEVDGVRPEELVVGVDRVLDPEAEGEDDLDLPERAAAEVDVAVEVRRLGDDVLLVLVLGGDDGDRLGHDSSSDVG